MRNIFICWSGDRSRRLASALQTYLPTFVPGLVGNTRDTTIFMSDDIAKGTRWFDEVEKELDSADAGVVCVTREALQSGWIHFEAGALARAVRKNEQARGGTLYTYLLGVQPDELTGPLGEFQSTKFEKEDTKKLCAAVVTSMAEHSPSREQWETAFEENWTKFEDAVKAIGPLPASALIPELEELFRRKTFNEPLEECTRQSWIDRYTGTRETIAGLQTYRPIMKADNSYLLDLYNELLGELDGYAMNMGALLLEEKKFRIDQEDGRLVIGNGIKRACESRRGRIRQLVTHLLAPNCAPVLETESRRFAKMASFDAKKTILIHPAERQIQQELDGTRPKRLTDEELSACATSLWEFDRIYFYLVQEKANSSQFEPLIESVEQEFEKVRAVEGGASLIPLHYAIRALKRRFQGEDGWHDRVDLLAAVRRLLASIPKFLEEFRLDKGQQVRDNIAEFRALLNDRTGAPQPRESL
jgi:hypothetical protein